MYCPKCGKEVEDNASFCSNCGESLKATEKKENKPSEYDNTPRTSMGVVLGLLLGLIGLLIGMSMYPQGTVARKTFLKAWGIAFGISCVIYLVLGIVIFHYGMNYILSI